MKLYGMPGACSMVPHTALEWAKADYELKLVDHATLKSPEYRAMNPQGAVPMIVDGGFILTQNVAILHYLNTRYPTAQLFVTGDYQRQAKAWQWLAFCNADVHKRFMPIFSPDNMVSDPAAQVELKDKTKDRIAKLLDHPNTTLRQQDFLIGEKTIADMYLYVMLRWSSENDIIAERHGALRDFIQRMEQDSGVQAVLAQEGLDKVGQ